MVKLSRTILIFFCFSFLGAFFSDPSDFGAGFGFAAPAFLIIFLAVWALVGVGGLLAAEDSAGGCGGSLTAATALGLDLVATAMSFSLYSVDGIIDLWRTSR